MVRPYVQRAAAAAAAMASPGASPRGQFASVEEYVDFVGGQRPIKKVRGGGFWWVGGSVGWLV